MTNFKQLFNRVKKTPPGIFFFWSLPIPAGSAERKKEIEIHPDQFEVT
jgi:hypothetical protein